MHLQPVPFLSRILRWNKARRARVAAVLACASTLLLLDACAEPPIGMHDVSVIGYDGKNAIPPDCTALNEPSVMVDLGKRRPSMAWGCATYSNLAAQLARPEDLVAPRALTPDNAAVAADAVRRYETNKVTPLNKESIRSN